MDIALTQFINNLSGRISAFDPVMIAITNYGIYFLVAATCPTSAPIGQNA